MSRVFIGGDNNNNNSIEKYNDTNLTNNMDTDI
jgi:hypothetical protein